MPYTHLKVEPNKTFAICDANNFYVSCERLFNPKLIGKPVIVLSNNDQCAIARSNEAKSLGVEMGAPLFQLNYLVKKHDIKVLSSNYALYGDISSRMIDLFMQMAPDVQVYSIDESFLDLSSLNKHYDLSQFCFNITQEVERCIGIPISIGISSTKTLAKVANRMVKKYFQNSRVLLLKEHDDIKQSLMATQVGDVWGIGRQWSKKLIMSGYENAYELSNMDSCDAKQAYNVNLLKTVKELQGESCIEIDDIDTDRKQIMVSKSFGNKLNDLTEIKYAASNYVSSAAEKMRLQGSVACNILVFLQKTGGKKQSNNSMSESIQLPYSTSDTRVLVKYVISALDKIFIKGTFYRKVGVMLSGLMPQDNNQIDLFTDNSPTAPDETMMIVDHINKRFGRNAIKLASSGFSREWHMKQSFKSQSFTTSWNELLVVKAH